MEIVHKILWVLGILMACGVAFGFYLGKKMDEESEVMVQNVNPSSNSQVYQTENDGSQEKQKKEKKENKQKNYIYHCHSCHKDLEEEDVYYKKDGDDDDDEIDRCCCLCHSDDVKFI